MSLRHLPVLLLPIALTAAACLVEDHPITDEPDAGSPDASSPDAGDPAGEIQGVDILFVVDNSNSMAEEQAILRDQVEVLLRSLIKPEGEGGLGPEPIDDLHVGVVTTDMGTGGVPTMSCYEPFVGDNGALQNTSELPGCEPSYGAADCLRGECPWLSHSTEHPDSGSDPANPPIWEDLGCIASLGTQGCGFEQQLEAAMAALTLQSEPGGANEGFLREDSLLVLVLITDEDDCSTGHSGFFDPSRAELGSLCTRCALNADLLYPVERYRDTLLELRGGDERRVVVAAIAGVPTDGTWEPGDDIEGLAELVQVDPESRCSLLPVCTSPRGNAFTSLRIARLVSAFGDSGVLSSICDADWTDTFRQLAELIHRRVGESS